MALAKANTFTLPADSWLFQAMSSADFARLASSYSARILAHAPRTRTERAAVNWTQVISRIDAGITADFAPVAQVDILWDDWKRLVARVRTGPPSDFGRPSYWLLGPADSANGFVNWVNTPLTSRVAFQIRTKDRRIQDATGPTSPGKYFGYSVEMVGVDAVVRFFDSRGWHLLPEGSFTQLPVPGRELGTLRLDLYTFGGPGGDASAPVPDPERCPVALPRCPA